jgi:hypothetical protein
VVSLSTSTKSNSPALTCNRNWVHKGITMRDATCLILAVALTVLCQGCAHNSRLIGRRPAEVIEAVRTLPPESLQPMVRVLEQVPERKWTVRFVDNGPEGGYPNDFYTVEVLIAKESENASDLTVDARHFITWACSPGATRVPKIAEAYLDRLETTLQPHNPQMPSGATGQTTAHP